VSDSPNLNDLDFTKMILSPRKLYSLTFFFDVLIMLINPIPYYDFIIVFPCLNIIHTEPVKVYYLLSDFLLAFMFMRVVFVFRSVINYSLFMDIYSKRLCATYGFSANTKFALKCYIKDNPGPTVMLTLLASIVILAYLMRLFELPYGIA
jgi:hypothetical protein